MPKRFRSILVHFPAFWSFVAAFSDSIFGGHFGVFFGMTGHRNGVAAPLFCGVTIRLFQGAFLGAFLPLLEYFHLAGFGFSLLCRFGHFAAFWGVCLANLGCLCLAILGHSSAFWDAFSWTIWGVSALSFGGYFLQILGVFCLTSSGCFCLAMLGHFSAFLGASLWPF